MQCPDDVSPAPRGLTDLILDYTRLCNSKCVYCGIWKEKNGPELSLEAIDRLLQAKALGGLKSCYVTGGEPYLTDKIIEIARLLRRRLPMAALCGATNGIQAGRILERVLAIRELGCPVTVDISINGTEAAHDRTRGESGFWKRAVSLMKKLREQGVPTNLAFSAMPETINDLPFVAQLAKDHGCGLGLSWVRHSPRYHNEAAPLSPWTQEQAACLSHIERLPDYFDCPAIKEILVVRPDGEVYPCETYHPALRLGNINETSLDDILASPGAAAVLRRIEGRHCDWCQGPGFIDGTPKWMIMDCYRRRARPRPQANQGAISAPGPALAQGNAIAANPAPEAPVSAGGSARAAQTSRVEAELVRLVASIEAALHRRDYAAALPELDQALALCPDQADLLVSRSFVHFQLGDLTSARGDLERAVTAHPGHQAARANLAALLRRLERLNGGGPRVSVVVPCYNQAQFLPDAVQSVVEQTFTDWEVIVVNDGSPDATSAVCRDLAARWPGRLIRCLEKPNGGLSDARNAGITAARGKYVLPLDADDKLHPAMLAKTTALLDACPELAIAYTDTLHFGAVNARVFAGRFTLANLCQHNLLSYCALYRREAWKAVGGYNTNMTLGYEDWDFWLGCAERGFQARRIPEFLLFYRVKNRSMLTNALEHDPELRARIILNHPGVYPAATVDQARALLQPAALARAN
jgi:MoaA/NifB/PqqE/SkfB family radical SAM enzyme/GT2 family glycosyltransferase